MRACRPLLLLLVLGIACAQAGGRGTGGGGAGGAGGPDAGALPDVPPVGDPDVPTLTSFGQPCEQGVECRSGHCVEADDGKVCSRACADETDCPEGWLCLPDARIEVQYICFPDRSNLCTPCAGNEDCDGQGSRCLGIGGGSYCGRVCSERRPCPDGYRCADILDPGSGEVVDRQCRPSDERCGECIDEDEDGYGVGPECLGPDCNDHAPDINPGAPERCNDVDDDCDHQTDEEAVDANECGGCGQTGAEDCNGEDDDCDGETDEGEDGGKLTRDCSTACGEGTEECLGGRWFNCTAQTPIPEICGDGIDNDCVGGDETRPDQYENNNTCAQAASLGDDPDTTIRASFDNVEDTNDYFWFHGDDSTWSDEDIEVDLRHIPPGVQVRLRWFKGQSDCERGRDQDGVTVCDGNPCIRFEETRCIAGCDETGDYYLQVERQGGSNCGETYELRVNGLN